MIVQFFDTPQDAINAASKIGRTVLNPIFKILGTIDAHPIYDTTTITGYYLHPNGIIHKDRKEGQITWTFIASNPG